MQKALQPQRNARDRMAADLGGAKGGGGSTAKNAYLQCLRSTLNAAICLTNFGCQEIERNNKPEVEMGKRFRCDGL
jgi:hypothetical protein